MEEITTILSRIVNLIRTALNTIRRKIEILLVVCLDTFYIRSKHNINSKPYIIILGGELFNKGAQAMTFITVDKLKQKYPDKEIFLFSSSDFKRDAREKGLFIFKILPWDFSIKTRLLNPFKRKAAAFLEFSNSDILNIIKDAAFFIDISGYAFGSQWGWFKSADYLLNIVIAKRFGVPLYILPQSFGPFNYAFKDRMLLEPLMRRYLKYPQKIFAREKEGFRLLSRYTNGNLAKTFDIVLQNDGYDLLNIYLTPPRINLPEIPPHSIAVIPNSKIIEHSASESNLSVYSLLMDALIKTGRNIYIIRHSYQDRELCKKLSNSYRDSDKVKLIEEDLPCYELENLIKRMDFVVASRYHAVIHSYKNGIPAMVIGWANKYKELLDEFNQTEYYFDVRKHIDMNKISNGIQHLSANHLREERSILKRLEIMKKVDVFSCLEKLQYSNIG